jgi:uncharacterized protein YbjT (DUF2867 family)
MQATGNRQSGIHNEGHILVTGATGNIGGKVADILLQENGRLRVNGRNEAKLRRFRNRAAVMQGSLEEGSFLQALLSGIKTVFLVMPELQTMDIPAFATLFTTTAKAAGVSHIVNISNCTLERWGQPTALLQLEQHLNDAAAGLHIKHLRCANFFENLNWGIHTPYRKEIRLPYISSYEVAQVAAQYVQQSHFTGISVDELMGKQDYSMDDFATRLGVSYRQLPAAPGDAAFFEAFNSGAYKLVQRTAVNTSRAVDEKFSLDYFLEHDFNKALIHPAQEK